MSTRLLSSRHHAHVSVSARLASSRSGVARQPSLIVHQTFLNPAPHFSNHKVRGMTSPRSDYARAGSHETKFRDTANRLATVWVSDMFLRYYHQPQTLHYSDAARHVRTVKTCHVKQLRPRADDTGDRATRAARRNGPIRHDTRPPRTYQRETSSHDDKFASRRGLSSELNCHELAVPTPAPIETPTLGKCFQHGAWPGCAGNDRHLRTTGRLTQHPNELQTLPVRPTSSR